MTGPAADSATRRGGRRSSRGGMGMAAMRWVDHWVGLPLCFLFGLVATVLRAAGLRRSRAVFGDRTLAVFKFFGLGSIIQTTPLLQAVRRRYPRARLAFVTFAENAGLLRQLNVCTDVRVIRTHSPALFAWDVLREILWLRRRRVEAVVDLEFFSKFSTLLALFSGARIRIGFHLNNFWRYSLITHPVYFNYYRHVTDIYRQVARELDADIGDIPLARLVPGPDARPAVERFLRAHGWRPGVPLLGINVNAGAMCPARRWPPERFVELIEQLAARHPEPHFVLTGTGDERAYVLSLAQRLSPAARSRSIVAAGEWTLEQFVAALSLFSAFLTNDSGPMHLAAAEGVPMVSLWGPGRPAFYAPRYERHRVIYRDYPCSPCLYMFTTFEALWCHGEGWCMQAIDVPTVVAAVEETLAGPPTGRGAPAP